MLVLQIDPCKDPRWMDLASTHELRSVFVSPAWLQVIRDTYNFELKATILLDDHNEVVAGIPYFEIADLLGPRRVILPFCDYADPLVSNNTEWIQLTENLPTDQPVKVRPMRSSVPLQDDRFKLLWKAKWHGMDICADEDKLISNIDGSARRGINKALREGVLIQSITSTDDLRKFYELHLRLRKKKYSLLAQPYIFFEKIWQLIVQSGNGAILKAEYEGKMIGAAMFLDWGDTTYYKISASDPTHKKYRISEVLIWEGIKYARSKGSTSLDLGLSDWDQEGLINFKRKFADSEKTIHQLHYSGPQVNESSSSICLRSFLPRLTDLFTGKLIPEKITELAGNTLYRYFT